MASWKRWDSIPAPGSSPSAATSFRSGGDERAMCAIAGVIEFDPNARVDGDRLIRMRDAMRHRGPDGEGLFLDGAAGLAHRRLAIVDVVRGHQPMANEDRTIWI